MFPVEEGSAATAAGPPNLAPLTARVNVQPQASSRASIITVATTPNVEALTRAARRGDAEAFSLLYDLYSFRIYRFLLVLARGDEEIAREVCQAVFIKLSKRCDVFEQEPRLWGWLCVLAKNTFLDHCRARQRLNRFAPLGDASPESEEPAKAEHQLAGVLGEVLDALPPDELELLQAAYVDKRPLRELAEEAGQTYKAVESRLGRLRQKVKEQLLKHLRHENESRSP